MQIRSTAGRLVLACCSGILLIASFPPWDLDVLAWLCLVPLLIALEGSRLGQAFVLSYVTGLVFFAGAFYWIWWVPGYNILDELLLAMYLPPYVALWGLGLRLTALKCGLPVASVAPSLWIALEYLRSNLGFLGLPWMLLGHSQYDHPALIQIASITGVYGLSFLIVLVNAGIANVISMAASPRPTPFVRLRFAAPATATVLVGAVLLYGVAVLPSRAGHEERIDEIALALLQTNVGRDEKWDPAQRLRIVNRNIELTREASRQSPQLIVWPETAVPGDVQHHPPLRRLVSEAAREVRTHLLVGSSEHAKFTDRTLSDRYYNSMFLFSPAGDISAHYRKITLVPFGEYAPLQDLVRWPKSIVRAVGGFLPGDDHTIFTVGPARFGALICWEILFPDLARTLVNGGANFLVNATNEAWFADTAVPHHLLAMTTFRAAENRLAIARSANQGISAFIDPFGRVRRRFDTTRASTSDGVLIGAISLSSHRTFYTRHGDVFAFVNIAVAVVLVLAASLRWLGRPLATTTHRRRFQADTSSEHGPV